MQAFCPTVMKSGQGSHLSASSAARGAILIAFLLSFASARSSRTTSRSWSAPEQAQSGRLTCAHTAALPLPDTAQHRSRAGMGAARAAPRPVPLHYHEHCHAGNYKVHAAFMEAGDKQGEALGRGACARTGLLALVRARLGLFPEQELGGLHDGAHHQPCACTSVLASSMDSVPGRVPCNLLERRCISMLC